MANLSMNARRELKQKLVEAELIRDGGGPVLTAQEACTSCAGGTGCPGSEGCPNRCGGTCTTRCTECVTHCTQCYVTGP